MSKPMIFGVDEAFKQLRDEGVVTTFRTRRRGPERVWVRRSRTGKKEFDAEIVDVYPVYPFHEGSNIPGSAQHVRVFADWSGFDSVSDWRDAIRDTHGEVEQGYVHVVKRMWKLMEEQETGDG